jgi:hypothetical protein
MVCVGVGGGGGGEFFDHHVGGHGWIAPVMPVNQSVNQPPNQIKSNQSREHEMKA